MPTRSVLRNITNTVSSDYSSANVDVNYKPLITGSHNNEGKIQRKVILPPLDPSTRFQSIRNNESINNGVVENKPTNIIFSEDELQLLRKVFFFRLDLIHSNHINKFCRSGKY